MKVSDLKDILDKKGVDYSKQATKKELIELLLNELKTGEIQEKANQLETVNLLARVKGAIKKEEPAKEENTDCYSYLAQRSYEMLDVAEREIVRSRSSEYENVEKGILVKLAERVPQGYRIVRLANGTFARFLEGTQYIVSEADYEAVKNLTVRRKTEETKNKCCGQAKYETVNLFEVVSNG